jgi:peptidyl-prolyl cis-trans isomerase SurA
MKFTKTTVLYAILLLAAGLLLAHIPARAGKVVNRIVARVNGEIITEFELDQRLGALLEARKVPGTPRELRQQLLEQMIDDILLAQEARRLEIEVADDEVDAQIEQIKKQSGLSTEKLERYIQNSQQLTMSEYRERIRQNILKNRLINFMVRRKVVVTEEAMRDYYQEHKDRFSQGGSVNLSLILYDPAAHPDLAERLESGDISFSKAARRYSVGPGAANGGRIGSIAPEDLAEAWTVAIQELEQGEISEPFRVENRMAILKLNSRQGTKTASFEDVREKIRQRLAGKRSEKQFESYMNTLRSKAIIDKRL